jgi:3-(3-hydroxy-phenyl)propionate hydroxylase
VLPDRLVHAADARRPSTYVPFAGRRRRWEFRLLPGEDPEAMTAPGVVAGLLRPYVDPAAVDVERATVYAFRSAVARPWRRGRLLVAGDAAHVMPPFVGQGLCAGLRDAAFLGWALASVARGASPETLLDAYELERRPHVVAATRLAVRAGRFIGMRPAAAAARDVLVALARRSPGLARRLDGVAAGAPRIPAVVAGTRGQPLRALPQCWLETAAGERLRLDDALGPGWAVLGIAIDPRTWAGEHPAWTSAGARFLRVLMRAEANHAAVPAVRDPADALAAWAGAGGRSPAAIVVRPDRFVFGVYGAGEGARAAEELGRWFGGTA